MADVCCVADAAQLLLSEPLPLGALAAPPPPLAGAAVGGAWLRHLALINVPLRNTDVMSLASGLPLLESLALGTTQEAGVPCEVSGDARAPPELPILASFTVLSTKSQDV